VIGINQGASVISKPSKANIRELLTPLSREELQTIVQNLVDQQPEWIEAIEQQIDQLASIQPTKPQKTSRRITVNPKPIEQQVEQILDRYSGQWNDYPAMEEIETLLQKADQLIQQGDGNNALVIVGAVIRAYVKDWMNLDGSSGESGEFFTVLDASLTAAILSAELSERDRQQWQPELEGWRAEVDNYGVDSFEMSLTALEQGWDYPPLQRVLQGEITELGAWADEAPSFADDLASIRLEILERQERYQDYLYLAEAEGQTDRYLRMLAKLGRTEEAIAQAQQQMTTADEALTLAQTLREQGQLEQALSIGHQGLALGGHSKHRLAIWVSELAEDMNPEVALEARLTAFQLDPSLSDYLKLQALAGDRWASLRQELLTQLQSSSSFSDVRAKAAIFLEEGMIEAAIATVDQLSSYESDIIQSVMDAAVPVHSDWVIANARRRAESIMNEGKAQYYYHAVNWLRKVRAAYLQLEQLEDWKQYRKSLLQTHARKRKLVSLLEQRDLI
jgi:uncharacterized Zn finger protein